MAKASVKSIKDGNQLKAFLDDIPLCIEEIRGLLHKEMSDLDIFHIEASYGFNIWHKTRFIGDNNTFESLEFHGDEVCREKFSRLVDFEHKSTKPIGILLNKSIEVYDFTKIDSAYKKTTHTVLYPGDIFGLFEAYADLSGNWFLTAGVQSIFVVSPALGQGDAWDGLSDEVGSINSDNMKIENKSRFNFNQIVSNCENWKVELLVFDANKIAISELRHCLQEFTIRQLSSLVKQNPRIDSGPSNTGFPVKYRDVSRFFDGVISGHLPVHVHVEEGERYESYFPCDELKKRIGLYIDKRKHSEDNDIEIWFPALLGKHGFTKGVRFFKLEPDRSVFKNVWNFMKSFKDDDHTEEIYWPAKKKKHNDVIYLEWECQDNHAVISLHKFNLKSVRNYSYPLSYIVNGIHSTKGHKSRSTHKIISEAIYFSTN